MAKNEPPFAQKPVKVYVNTTQAIDLIHFDTHYSEVMVNNSCPMSLLSPSLPICRNSGPRLQRWGNGAPRGVALCAAFESPHCPATMASSHCESRTFAGVLARDPQPNDCAFPTTRWEAPMSKRDVRSHTLQPWCDYSQQLSTGRMYHLLHECAVDF